MTDQQFLKALEDVLVDVADIVEQDCSLMTYTQHRAVLAEVRRRLEQVKA